MRKALWAFLCTGIFLLMLSALVVTPETPAAAGAVPVLPEDLHAVFRPAVLPPPVDTADGGLRQAEIGMSLLCAFLLAAVVLPRLCPTDANGRIITAVRYENSVYQLFRPEVAGG